MADPALFDVEQPPLAEPALRPSPDVRRRERQAGGGAVIGSLFSGVGMLDVAVTEVLGGQVAWHVESNSAASRVLGHRWPVPNYGDITTVDWNGVGPVDVLTGGFPCQDVSTAGQRAGIRPGTRSGLWSHMAYAIERLRPGLVLIENVRGLASAWAHSDLEPCPWCVGDGADRAVRALGAVLGDLADLGYDASWCGLRAADVGAPHGRYRIFILARPADPTSPRRRTGSAGRLNGKSTTSSRTPELGRHDRAAVAVLPTPVANDARASVKYPGGRPSLNGIATTAAADWTTYEPAIRHWEAILGRPAPAPTITGQRGGRKLNPALCEWMMGWPAGWVTAVPGVSVNDQLRLAGNGVVPQQAVAALEWLLAADLDDRVVS